MKGPADHNNPICKSGYAKGGTAAKTMGYDPRDYVWMYNAAKTSYQKQ